MEERLDNLGEGIESGTVVELLIAVGDSVSEGQTLVEIESEKAVVAVPASHAGVVVKIHISKGDTLSVGQTILEYQTASQDSAKNPGNDSPRPKPVSLQQPIPQAPVIPIAPSTQPRGKTPPPTGSTPKASPTVRRIAHQLQLDLRLVTFRSRGDRVELPDLAHWIQSLIATAHSPQQNTSRPQKTSPTIPFESWGPVSREKLSGVRKAIGRHMVESKNSQPHVTQFETVDITDLEAARKSQTAAWKAAGCPLTLTALATKAAVQTLQKHPIFNASLDESTDEIVFKNYYHIGIATDTNHGLMVPIIRDADHKTLTEIAKNIPKLAQQARDRTISSEEMNGGSFTISNQGGIGGGHFTPVINRPESAILGIGKGKLQACVVDSKIQARLMLPLTLSYDHRLIDGGSAVRFILDFIDALQSLAKEDLNLSQHQPMTEKQS